MKHRSVSGASRELGVTPSAVSHALTRLRQTLNDELFVPGESGMEPTARALELAPNIREGLARLAEAANANAFVPSDAVRLFRISVSDYIASVILPHLLHRVAKVAPQISLMTAASILWWAGFRIFPTVSVGRRSWWSARRWWSAPDIR
jgi:DNA-binding transcriptional LysR family regulator